VGIAFAALALAAGLAVGWLARSINAKLSSEEAPEAHAALPQVTGVDPNQLLLQRVVDAVARRRASEAWALMATAYRSAVPVDRFTTVATQNPFLAAGGQVVIQRTRVSGGAIEIEGLLQTPTGPVGLKARGADEAQGRRLTMLMLGAAPAVPAP